MNTRMRLAGFALVGLSLLSVGCGSGSSGELVGISGRRIEASGFVFDARVAGAERGELVLLLHGFPQSSLEWEAQLETLGRAGYRAVAPDQRGYSRDARPIEVEA